MMTSLRNSPLSRQARSSLVTVIRPLQGGAGYWINLKAINRGFGQNNGAPQVQTLLTPRVFTWWEAAAGQKGSGWASYISGCFFLDWASPKKNKEHIYCRKFEMKLFPGH